MKSRPRVKPRVAPLPPIPDLAVPRGPACASRILGAESAAPSSPPRLLPPLPDLAVPARPARDARARVDGGEEGPARPPSTPWWLFVEPRASAPAPPARPVPPPRPSSSNDVEPILSRLRERGFYKLAEVIAARNNLTLADMFGPRRMPALVRARAEMALVLRQVHRRSWPEIGEALGGRDHTTIMHAVRTLPEGTWAALVPLIEPLFGELDADRASTPTPAPSPVALVSTAPPVGSVFVQ